jgi:hypothetical protein
MTAAIIAISIILTAFVNGLHNDAIGHPNEHRYFRNGEGYIGAPGRPEDWPDDGAGCHSGSQKWQQSNEKDDDFVGTE